MRRPPGDVANEVINVGQNLENFRIAEIAKAIAAEFPRAALSFGEAGPDPRSYRVNFDKLARLLPEARPEWTLPRGLRQLHELFQATGLSEADFAAVPFSRIAAVLHLLRTGQIDDAFFWKQPAERY